MRYKRMAVILLCCVAGRLEAAPAPETTDRDARAVAEQAIKAFLARDVETYLKLADVPWFHDRKKVITDAGELQRTIRKLFDEKKDRELVGATIRFKEVLTVDKARSLLLRSAKMLDEVLTKDDRVVVFIGSNSRGNKETVLLLVRLRDGKPRLVGVSD